jgi:hypothetical protein
MVHYEVEPIKAFVESDILFGGEDRGVIPCTIFGISLYKGEAITFGVELEDGSVFFYIPPHKIFIKNRHEFSLETLVYHNCPSEVATVKHFSFLDKSEGFAYFKELQKWAPFKYLYTIDWYEGNDLLHMVLVEDNVFAFLPSHKLKFSNNKTFQEFKKLKYLWQV